MHVTVFLWSGSRLHCWDDSSESQLHTSTMDAPYSPGLLVCFKRIGGLSACFTGIFTVLIPKVVLIFFFVSIATFSNFIQRYSRVYILQYWCSEFNKSGLTWLKCLVVSAKPEKLRLITYEQLCFSSSNIPAIPIKFKLFSYKFYVTSSIFHYKIRLIS